MLVVAVSLPFRGDGGGCLHYYTTFYYTILYFRSHTIHMIYYILYIIYYILYIIYYILYILYCRVYTLQYVLYTVQYITKIVNGTITLTFRAGGGHRPSLCKVVVVVEAISPPFEGGGGYLHYYTTLYCRILYLI